MRSKLSDGGNCCSDARLIIDALAERIFPCPCFHIRAIPVNGCS